MSKFSQHRRQGKSSHGKSVYSINVSNTIEVEAVISEGKAFRAIINGNTITREAISSQPQIQEMVNRAAASARPNYPSIISSRIKEGARELKNTLANMKADQKEIDSLQSETRELLNSLKAA